MPQLATASEQPASDQLIMRLFTEQLAPITAAHATCFSATSHAPGFGSAAHATYFTCLCYCLRSAALTP